MGPIIYVYGWGGWKVMACYTCSGASQRKSKAKA